jgi:hypothetical protein
MIETVHTLKGIPVKAKLVQEFPKGRLFYAQERLMVTDNNNKELKSMDIIELVTGIKDPVNSEQHYV